MDVICWNMYTETVSDFLLSRGKDERTQPKPHPNTLDIGTNSVPEAVSNGLPDV